MGFSNENGYVPLDIDAMMLSVMNNINSVFELDTPYTVETFAGTNFYKYFYAQVQRMYENEVKTSEIFIKLQEYFDIVNAEISRPKVTPTGIIGALDDADYVSSVKPMVDADAGKISVCVDANDGVHASGKATITNYANLVSGTDDAITVGATVFTAQAGSATLGTGTFQAAVSNAATASSLATQINAHATAGALVRAYAFGAMVLIRAIHGGTAGNSIVLTYTDNDTNVGATVSGSGALAGGTAAAGYAADKLEIAGILKESIAAGIVSQGTETESLTLTNGQAFDFKYYLPSKIPIYLKITTTLSDNNTLEIEDPEDQKQALIDNIEAKYSLGKNFEPQRYFTVVDAPWASQVLVEWSADEGATWSDDIFEADFDELLVPSLANVTLVEI